MTTIPEGFVVLGQKLRKQKNPELAKDAILAQLRDEAQKVSEPPSENQLLDLVDELMRHPPSAVPTVARLRRLLTPATLTAASLTQEGIVDYIASELHPTTRWCQSLKTWFHWSSTENHWKAQDREGALEKVKRLAWAIDPDMGAKEIEATLRLIKSDPLIAVRAGDFDRFRNLLGTRNGIIDLDAYGDPERRNEWFLSHEKGDTRNLLLTKGLPVEFNPDARCPLTLRHIERMFEGRKADIRLLQAFVGMALYGEVKNHGFLFLEGDGGNGKGTLERLLLQLFGAYAVSPSSELLQRTGRSKDYNLAPLRGKRLVALEEVEGFKVDTGLLRKLTGGDVMDSRNPYEQRMEVEPTWSLMLIGNERPDMGGDMTTGLWRRPWLLNASGQVPLPGSADYIPNFEARLEEELPGVLNWALAGLVDWRENSYQLPLTEEHFLLREEYRGDEDPFMAWAEEKLRFDQAGWAASADLVMSLKVWWGYNKMDARQLPSEKKLWSWLRRKECAREARERDGKKVRGWKGVAVAAVSTPVGTPGDW